MQVITHPGRVIYVAETNDWRIAVEPGRFEIQPNVGGLEYSSGRNLTHLAQLIVAAEADARARGIDWDNG